MQKITPCLWFNGDAEDAASFYVTLLPNSRIDRVFRSPADTPSRTGWLCPYCRIHVGRNAVRRAEWWS